MWDLDNVVDVGVKLVLIGSYSSLCYDVSISYRIGDNNLFLILDLLGWYVIKRELIVCLICLFLDF